MRSVTGPLKRSSRALAVATVAIAAGGGAAVLVTSSSAPAQAAEEVQIQAYTVPSAAYQTPLGSPELPMLPDPAGTGEWFIVSGASSATLLDESAAGGTPTIVASGFSDNSGKSPYLSMANAGGSVAAWAEADGSGLLALGSTGNSIKLPGAAVLLKADSTDMTADGSGNLYIPWPGANGIVRAASGQISVADPDFSKAGWEWSLPSGFGTPKPEAVSVAGGQLWFTTSAGELGSIQSPTTNANDTGPPIDEQPGGTGPANGNGHTLTAGADGDLWAVGGGQSGSGGSQILRIDPNCGAIASTYSGGLDANPEISAITSGPDGNIWFTESGANAIGELDIATGAITDFPLPAGFQLPAPGSDMIASGPAPTGTVFFSAEASGAPAVGIISGLATSASVTTAPSGCGSSTTTGTTSTTTTATGTTTTTTTTTTKSATTTGRPSVARSAKVSSKGVARIAIKCTGEAACSGKLVLELIRTEKVKVKHKTVRKRVTTAIGSARFKVKAGRSGDVSIHLAHVAVLAVAGALHHRLSLTAKLEPAGAKARTSSLSLTGPTPPKR